jgi:acyl dehydratase
MRRDCADAEWFEDYRVGDEFAGEPVSLSEPEIIEFARRYDAQWFHIDPVAARDSPYGGLIASGMQSFAAVWGGLIRAGLLNGRGLGGPGVDLRWLKPVRPGDTLATIARVVETKASQSRPDRGFVSFEIHVTNQDGELVMTFALKEMVRRRPGVA